MYISFNLVRYWFDAQSSLSVHWGCFYPKSSNRQRKKNWSRNHMEVHRQQQFFVNSNNSFNGVFHLIGKNFDRNFIIYLSSWLGVFYCSVQQQHYNFELLMCRMIEEKGRSSPLLLSNVLQSVMKLVPYFSIQFYSILRLFGWECRSRKKIIESAIWWCRMCECVFVKFKLKKTT